MAQNILSTVYINYWDLTLDTCVMLWSASLQPLTEPEVSARGIAVLLQRAPGKLGNQGAVLIRP